MSASTTIQSLLTISAQPPHKFTKVLYSLPSVIATDGGPQPVGHSRHAEIPAIPMNIVPTILANAGEHLRVRQPHLYLLMLAECVIIIT